MNRIPKETSYSDRILAETVAPWLLTEIAKISVILNRLLFLVDIFTPKKVFSLLISATYFGMIICPAYAVRELSAYSSEASDALPRACEARAWARSSLGLRTSLKGVRVMIFALF